MLSIGRFAVLPYLRNCFSGGGGGGWFDEQGNPIWPPNRGFDGEPVTTTLQPGTDAGGGRGDKRHPALLSMYPDDDAGN